MKVIVALIALLPPSLALAQALPRPKPPGPCGSCPQGYTSSGSLCVPPAGARDADPAATNGTCRYGWTRSGNYCLHSGSGR